MKKKTWGIHTFMAIPAFLLFAVFFLYPLGRGLQMSLTNWDLSLIHIFRSDKHAAVLRLQRTQPKDRRVYTAFTGILAERQAVQKERSQRAGTGLSLIHI